METRTTTLMSAALVALLGAILTLFGALPNNEYTALFSLFTSSSAASRQEPAQIRIVKTEDSQTTMTQPAKYSLPALPYAYNVRTLLTMIYCSAKGLLEILSHPYSLKCFLAD